MTPPTWIDRLLWFLAPFRWIQCCVLLPFKHGRGGGAYCVRCKGHPGQHETNNGESFTDGDCLDRKDASK